MKNLNVKSKQTSLLLGVIVMVAIVTLSPHAFAQNFSQQVQQGANQIAQQSAQPNGIPLGSQYSGNGIAPATSGGGGVQYTDSDNPTGPLQSMGWAVGIAVFSVMSGIGVWTAVRKH